MREIIFRGKSNSGEWVYGSLVYSDTIQPAIYFEVGKGTVKSFDWCYVDPDTVGQFTEMCDKNGNRIFEGDIVRFTNGQKRDSEGNWIDNTQNYEVSFQFGCHNIISFCSCQDAIEIIGNIYDKKEGE